MKNRSKLLILLFTILIALFFTLLYFTLFHKSVQDNIKEEKLVSLNNLNDALENSNSKINSYSENALTSFVALKENETLISTLTVDFNKDSFEDQVIVTRHAASPYIYLVVCLYDVIKKSYIRLAEIPTRIMKSATFSYSVLDMVGNHGQTLLYQGLDDEGQNVLKLFIYKKVGNKKEVRCIGDFSSNASIFIEKAARGNDYEIKGALGTSHKVWVYSNDKDEEGEGEHIRESIAREIVQTRSEYQYSYDRQSYVKVNSFKNKVSSVSSETLYPLQAGNVRAFTTFLTGLWRKKAYSSKTYFIYFDYENEEIVFLQDNAQGVYLWEENVGHKNGLYLTSSNSIILSMKRNIDVNLLDIDRVAIYVKENVGLVISENNLWDGEYERVRFVDSANNANEFSEFSEDEKGGVERFRQKLTGSKWEGEGGGLWSFNNNEYSVEKDTSNIEEEGSKRGEGKKERKQKEGVEDGGVYTILNVGGYTVLQVRNKEDKEHLLKFSTYALQFDVKEVGINKGGDKRIVNDKVIYLVPVKLSPLNLEVLHEEPIMLKERPELSSDDKDKLLKTRLLRLVL